MDSLSDLEIGCEDGEQVAAELELLPEAGVGAAETGWPELRPLRFRGAIKFQRTDMEWHIAE